MRLDSTTFPVVKIVFDAPNEGGREDAFVVFESLLARQQSFVLLHEKAVDENNHEHSHEERKHASNWMKTNRQALRAYRQRHDPGGAQRGQRRALKPFAVTFGKAWGYPLLVVESKDRAWALARDVLDEQVSDVAIFEAMGRRPKRCVSQNHWLTHRIREQARSRLCGASGALKYPPRPAYH